MNIVSAARNRDARHLRRCAGAALAAGAGAAVLVAPAQAAAKPIIFKRQVTVNKGVLARGSTVKVMGTVRHPAGKVSAWWSAETIAKVVRVGVNGRSERPYRSRGYACAPTATGRTARFRCTLRGADVATTVRLTFSVTYRAQKVGSGAPGGHPVTISVAGVPAKDSVVVSFNDGTIDGGHVTYTASSAAGLFLTGSGPSITAAPGAALSSAKLTTTVTPDTASQTAVTGTAQVPAGATLRISLDGQGQVVGNGTFTLPLS
jgi:hypothetical protein